MGGLSVSLLLLEQETEMTDPKEARRQKVDEIHFLADNFGIAPVRGAELVADGSDADDLASEAMIEERQRDPLAGVPVPGPDKDPEHIEKGVADLHKPIAHRRSAPT